MTDSSGRSASAAWKAWIESDEGKQCADASTLTGDVGTYLLNRLWRAFMAGVVADTRVRASRPNLRSETMTDRETTERLHAAVCQAVALLNRAPDLARSPEGSEAHNLLRQALVDYADRQPRGVDVAEMVVDLLCRMNEAPGTHIRASWKYEIQRAIVALRTA